MGYPSYRWASWQGDLTEAQARALRALYDRRDRADYGGPWAKPCRDSRTLSKLADRGYVEIRLRNLTLDYEGRITEKGVRLIESNGEER